MAKADVNQNPVAGLRRVVRQQTGIDVAAHADHFHQRAIVFSPETTRRSLPEWLSTCGTSSVIVSLFSGHDVEEHFNSSFTLSVPPATETGLMPYALCDTENSP